MRSATYSIYDVKVTTRAEDVQDCRLIESVDSRDKARGCGLTVDPTPEECLRYQVVRAGGDTLLINGPVGKAYECRPQAPRVAAQPASAPPAAEPTAVPPTIGQPAEATPAPAPRPSPPPSPVPTAAPASQRGIGGIRIVQSREAVKGCVYVDDLDLRTMCSQPPGAGLDACISDRAFMAGGNLVLLDGDKAEIFYCKKTP